MKPVAQVTLALAFMISAFAAPTVQSAAAAATSQPAAASAAEYAELMSRYGRPVAWWLQRTGAEPQRRNIQLQDDLPVVPASTIKPLLTLIALEVGALSGADEVLPWDGRRYDNFPEWMKPSALNQAMGNSNESYFRTLADRIGHDRLAEWIARVGYGNQQFGPNAADSMHDGVLLITAKQQLEFYQRFGRGDLPFSRTHLATVRASMHETSRGGVEVFGKTGTHLPRGGSGEDGFGWWVGWVEHDDEITSFALKVKLADIDGRPKRIALGLQLLTLDGVLPAE